MTKRILTKSEYDKLSDIEKLNFNSLFKFIEKPIGDCEMTNWMLAKAEYEEWQEIRVQFSGDNFAEMFYWIVEMNAENVSFFPNLYSKLFDDEELINAIKAWNKELIAVCN